MAPEIEHTNWYIITGGPSTGKSKTIDHLAYLGYLIRPEVARIIIDNEMSKGKTLNQIRGNTRKFENEILKIKLETEKEAPKKNLIFWEREMPDSLVYLKDFPKEYKKALKESNKLRYKGVFILDILPCYEKDYARTENSEKAKIIHENLRNTYIELGYRPISVPVKSIAERAKFIVKHIY